MHRAMVSLRLSILISSVAAAAAFSPSHFAARCTQQKLLHGALPSSYLIRSQSPTTRLYSDTNNNNNNNISNDFDDFAEFSSAQLTSSSMSTDGEGCGQDDDDGSSFLSSLQSRVQQVQDRSNQLPLMILDTMLPRQILQIQIQHPTLKSLMKQRLSQETPTLGMLGMAKLSTGQTVPLKTGVEVEIIRIDKATEAPPSDTDSIDNDDEESWDISLSAGRRFIIEGEVDKTMEGWTEAQVKFLNSSEEEEHEIKQFTTSPAVPSMDDVTGLAPSGDRLSVARAISKSNQFTQPNMNMKNGASLVDRWIELAKENERHPGQIDALLAQLGQIPAEHEPTERAFWVGALINPLPSMGVAMEIRPALLVSKKAEERVQISLDGILKSIRHMDGSARMW